ncbi:MAG: VIT domain-containing protein [Planctomycetota bacterium]
MRSSSPRLFLAAALLGLAAPATAQESGPDPQSASLGTVADREGCASLRRASEERWELASERQGLEPGDWVKVATRGPNALRLKFGRGELLLGPGALVELVRATELRVLAGEVKVAPAKGERWRVHAPQEGSLSLEARSVVRADRNGLHPLAQDPKWLSGYEEHRSTEAMGSLLAKVDGRDVSLSMGYHKVTVDIRDQIARTVVEESFVNHTSHVLEGVFYFPLPADASISGFGMWIGSELVHGEIVEKQRARAIYETILREKRDPGLLEWAGGNVFKARVYPIAGEKRIRISYTQVLPKEGAGYRYHYALESELLRAHPLRQLELQVTLSSTEGLKAVSCPSHPGRLRTTEHSASFEFSASEFTPERDFELRVETPAAGAAGRVTLAPHQRGDDGYFLCLVDPPAASSQASPAAAPLDVIVVADTSASVAGPARENQVRFIEALLSGLGAKDRFNLLTADSEVRWLYDQAHACSPVEVEAALAFVEARRPLGWSDLDAAFQAAAQRAQPRTQIVYVGDGAVTTGDADPVAFAARLRQAYPGRGDFHAVQPGSGGEAAVLRAIASCGGGSQRAIGGGTDPAQVAAALLQEIVSPKLTGLEVSFGGFATAAVYPRDLPNLPLGTQQVLVGRFQPQGKVQGRVLVRGRLGGQPFRAEQAVAFETHPGDGNSFVPRLWARQHLDALLEQGRNAETQRRVIALSEDFQIITPYTSFLVLESEADRVRFQVQKRFRMRDGEEFFAKGRDDATYELRRQQLLAAKKWRVELRAKLLEQLQGLNRDLTDLLRRGNAQAVALKDQGAALQVAQAEAPRGGAGGKLGMAKAKRELSDAVEADGFAANEASGGEALPADAPVTAAPAPPGEPPMSPPPPPGADKESFAEEEVYERKKSVSRLRSAEALSGRLEQGRRSNYAGYGPRHQEAARDLARSGFLPLADDRPPEPWNGLLAMFPGVPDPQDPAAFQPLWHEGRDVLLLLDRRAWLQGRDKTLSVRTHRERVDLRKRTHPGGDGRALLGKQAFAVEGVHVAGDDVRYDWLEGQERGALHAVWGLGRKRAREAHDPTSFPAVLPWLLADDLRTYAGYSSRVTLKPGTLPICGIRLEPPLPPAGLARYLYPYRAPVLELKIDVTKNVLLSCQWWSEGRVTATDDYSEFVEIGGAWFPGKVVRTDERGRATWTTTWTYEDLDEAAAKAARAALVPRARTTVLGKLPGLDEARQAVEQGKATLEDRLVALSPLVGAQKWEEADAAAQALWQTLADAASVPALQARYLSQRRRNEELEALLTTMAKALAQPRVADLAAAWGLLSWAGALHPGQETLALLDVLKPVFARQQRVEPLWPWEQRALAALAQSDRPEELFRRQGELVKAYPFQFAAHTIYAEALFQRGQVSEALAHLRDALAKQGPWEEHEANALREALAEELWRDLQYPELVQQIDAWDQEQLDPPLGAHHYNRVLSALVMLDRAAEAEQRAAKWFEDAVKSLGPRGPEWSGPLLAERAAWQRLHGAVSHLLGDAQGYYPQWIVPEHAAQLAKLAERLAEGVSGAPSFVDPDAIVQQILWHWRFRQTDASRPLIDALYARLEQGAESLPLSRLVRLTEWIGGIGHRPADDAHGWKQLWERIYTRWTKTEDEGQAAALAELIARYGERELNLKRLRRQLAAAQEPAQKRDLTRQLFDLLRTGPWSEDAEREVLALYQALAPLAAETGEAHEVALNDWIALLEDLDTWLAEARADAALAALPEHNLLDRRQLKERREGLLREARTALRKALVQRGQSWAEPLRPWLALEALWLGAKLGAAPLPLVKEARGLLKQAIDAATASRDSRARDLRWRVVASRAVATQIVLLADGTSPELVAERAPLIALIEQALGKDNALLDWRQIDYSLLLATNELDALRARLAKWFGEGAEVAQRRWGRALAFLFAERGELKESVAVLEKLGAELSHAEWRRVADLYACLDRREDVERAKLQSWRQLDEWALNNGLSNDFYRRYQRRGNRVPEELDAEVPVRFVALLTKARNPAQHVWLLRQYYAGLRDFRLLRCVPEAALGMSSQGIYPLLGSFKHVVDLLQEEATLDQLRKHLDSLAARAKTPLDRRALDLLLFSTERRAAEQSHGAGPHADAALAALQRAFQAASWEEGEQVRYAGFLVEQGRMGPAGLAREQVRQLRALLAGAKVASEEHLALSVQLAQVLWTYSQHDEAIQTIEAGLRAQRGPDGVLSASARGAFDQYVGYLEGVRAWRRGEEVLQAELKLGGAPQVTARLEQRLDQLYLNALRLGGEVSLGTEAKLYQALLVRCQRRAREARDEHQAYAAVNASCQLIEIRAQHRNGRSLRPRERGAAVREVADDLTRLAFNELPRVLDRFRYRNGQNMVSRVTNSLENLIGGLTTVEFLVARAESEPSWLRLCGWDFWSQHGWRFAYAREKAGDLSGRLRARALAIVLAALREDLREGRARNRAIYDRRNSHHWQSAQGEFLTTAREVLAKDGDAEPVLLRVADYLYHGLGEPAAAIAALAERHAAGRLGRGGRRTLVVYLREQRRHQDAIHLLQGLIAERPDELQERLWLVESAYHAHQAELSEQTLVATLKLLKEQQRWHEGEVAMVARTCVETRRSKQAAELWEEAIQLHTRGRANRGVGDGTLGEYYRQLASARAQLGDTIGAVDAAAGAVVVWANHRHQRGLALQRLNEVLKAAEVLEDYVAHLDQEVAKTGLENPLLRRAIAEVYMERRKFEQAARQLELSVEGQPNDQDSQRLLIQAYDALGRPDRAAEQLLALARIQGHDPKLYVELGDRYARANQPAEAERAYTTLVEMQPNEAAAQQALAEVRERQGKLEDAAVHWRQVIRVRTDEPGGLLGLCRLYLRMGKHREAARCLSELRKKEWPDRFDKEVHRAVQELERLIKPEQPETGKDF